jgi:hypothetical protein
MTDLGHLDKFGARDRLRELLALRWRGRYIRGAADYERRYVNSVALSPQIAIPQGGACPDVTNGGHSSKAHS